MASRLGEAFVTISARMDRLQTDLTKARREVQTSIAGMQARIDSLQFSGASSGLMSIAGAAQTAAVALAGMSVAAATIGTKFNATVESSTVGIAALLSAQGKFTDAQGVELQGRDKINAALKYSGDLVRQLQVDNLKTTATFEQLLSAFQVTLAPGLAKGLDVNQIRQYTLAMVQAAAAMQVPLDMMAEETRSLLEGTIVKKNTRIATALGITPEDVKQWEGNASGWFQWVMGRLDAFQQFGGIIGETYSGLLSNAGDALSNILGQATRPFFDELKSGLKEFYDYAVQVDEVTGTMRLNPELINAVELLTDLMRVALGAAKALAVALIEVGNAYKKIKDIAAESSRAGNLGFIGPELADFTNEERLRRIRELMEQIRKDQETIANWQAGGPGGSLMGAPQIGLANLDISASVTALENFRDQMVKAGQNTDELDQFLKSLKSTSDDVATAQDAAAGSVDKVNFSAGNAIPNLETFKSLLKEIAGIDLSGIGKSLDKALVEVEAKIKIAEAGGKAAAQTAAARAAATSAELSTAWSAALAKGAGEDVFAEIRKQQDKNLLLQYKANWLEGVNEANKEARKAVRSGGGGSPIDIARIDQDILRFKERVDKLYREIADVNADYEADRLEASGQYYEAEQVRMSQRVSNQKAAYAKEIADAQQAYKEMAQKLQGKTGSTPEAQQALEDLKTRIQGLTQAQEEYNASVDRAAQQTLKLADERRKLQTREELAQLNEEYVNLTGTMREQYEAQIRVIEATARYYELEHPGELAIAYRQLADEKIRIAQINATGSFAEGMADEARVIRNEIPTAAMEGREAMRTFQRGIEQAADALAEFCMTGKLDFGSFAQSIIKDLIKMQIQAMLTKGIFGGSEGGGGFSFGGIFSFLGGLFGGGKASGGNLSPGGLYLVGERGPEFIKMGSKGGNAIPMDAGAKPVQINIKNTPAGSKFEQEGEPRREAGGWVFDLVYSEARNNPQKRAALRQLMGSR